MSVQPPLLSDALLQRRLLSSSAFHNSILTHSHPLLDKFYPLGRSLSHILHLSAAYPLTSSSPFLLGAKQSLAERTIKEGVDDLLSLPIPSPTLTRSLSFRGEDDIGAEEENVPLIEGFQVLRPDHSPSKRKFERRRRREKVLGIASHEGWGLKEMADRERGLLQSSSTTTALSSSTHKGKKRKGRASHMTTSLQLKRKTDEKSEDEGFEVVDPLREKEEWEREVQEVKEELEGVKIRRTLLKSEISTISKRISSLTLIRDELTHGLLELREEELELEEELESVRERLAAAKGSGKGGLSTGHSSLRRRKGPAFLPSEHDELPSGVAFMTLNGHSSPITSLDFTEPYGTLISASLDETVRVWDLTSGEEWGRLRGHKGTVKCVQVEGTTCVSGGVDGGIRIWDLEKVHVEGDEEIEADGFTNVRADDIDGAGAGGREDPACMDTLEGHSKPVTSLYFDGNCLVTGSSDKTLRQWDMVTGQCVLTMDILWALSSSHSSRANLSSSTILPLPGEEAEVDFVGGVQFWGYALASGSAEGTVRMWDMRTGQSHRSLIGHTGPVTGIQFDESCLMSGSLDKSVRIWDLRTGGILETIKYDGPVTDLQFDSRKIGVAASENGVKLYNRTTLQHSSLVMNGHLNEVKKLRFLDRYLVSGGLDCTVKVWSV